MHAAQLPLLPLGELGLLAAQLAPRPSDRYALARAQADQVGLELGEGGQDVKNSLPIGPVGS